MKTYNRRLIALLLIAVLISGCSAGPNAELSPFENKNSITITDLSGAEYSFPGPLHHVVVQWSLAGGPFMTMAALLGNEIADYIVCMDSSPQKYRADIWKHFTDEVPELADIPVIGSADEELNIETILASGAEAVIAPLDLKTVIDNSYSEQLNAAHIPVIYVDYHSETPEKHAQSTKILGSLFGKTKRAEDIIAFYNSHREAVIQRVNTILQSKERPNIYIEVGMMGPSDFGNSFDNHYSWGGIAHEAGGNSIGEGVIHELAPLDSEYILSADPEIIVFTGSYSAANPDSCQMGIGVTEEDARDRISGFFNRTGWKSLQAFRNGRVYAIHHGLAREMYDCASFEFFAKVCFPEELKDLSPQETLQTYFDTFLPFSLQGVWFLS